MEYAHYDNSGTDEDLPPTHRNRIPRGARVAGNEIPPVGRSASYSRTHAETDVEAQIHKLEQDAYSAVLRAFKAQSDAITWEKESLITELRKELHLSNEEHRELLNQVNTDNVIKGIRELRQGSGHQTGMLSTTQAFHEPIPSPTLSASHKKQKMALSVPSQSYAAPSLSFHPQTISASHHPSSNAKRGAFPGDKGKKHKHYKSLPLGGRNQVASESTEGAALVGRRVRIRWPEDSNFYEAVICEYNPVEGRHALLYDGNTPNEAWEWINLSEISPNDIQWVAEDSVVSRQRGYGGAGHEINRAVDHSHVPGTGRGRGPTKGQFKKDSLPPQNGGGKNGSDVISILCTNTLVEKVKRIFSLDHPDPIEMETAKKYLKDHEQALIDAIAKLGYISDGESDEGGGGGGNEFSLARCVDRS